MLLKSAIWFEESKPMLYPPMYKLHDSFSSTYEKKLLPEQQTVKEVG